MSFEITERQAPYQNYAAALKAKMQKRQLVRLISSHDRRYTDLHRAYVLATSNALLIECDLMDAIEAGMG